MLQMTAKRINAKISCITSVSRWSLLKLLHRRSFCVCCHSLLETKHAPRTGREIGLASLKTGEFLKIKFCTEHSTVFSMYMRVYFSIIRDCSLEDKLFIDALK